MTDCLSLIEREKGKEKGLVISIPARQKYTRVLGVGWFIAIKGRTVVV